MRLIDRIARLVLAFALAVAAPALVGAPAALAAPVGVSAQQVAEGGGHALEAHAFHHDCGDPASAPASHHAAPDCAVCCCALPAPLAAPSVSRVHTRLAHVETARVLASFSRAPPAPPPRA